MELLIGCGNDRKKKVTFKEIPDEWSNELVTLDIDESIDCDVHHDLNILPLPFDDNTFDEIHAYEVLEHCGKQGDWRFFFDQFSELHRILKKDGFLVATVPMWDSLWAWGDPGHTRIISDASLTYLSQAEYEKQVGNNAMTDYRGVYKADFDLFAKEEGDDTFGFVLRAIK
jgi:SAM-dependent methyltransferase